MDSIGRLRDATRMVAGRVTAVRHHNSSLFVTQRKGFGYHSDIKGLPSVALAPIQDVHNAGAFHYMAGIDGFGNAPLGGGTFG